VVNDNELQVEISEGVRVRLAKSAVSEVLAKTEPSAREGAAEVDDDAKGKESK
jgi:preprotein translocase subunit YajC